MSARRALQAGAALLAVAVTATACRGGSTSDDQATAAFDPATCQGGQLTVLNSSDITHLDPARLYTSGGGAIPSLLFRTLTTRNRAAGDAGTRPAPDLATDLGTPSDNARTWTYRLKDGLKFEDGSPITAADVKYGIERSFAPELPGGAPYLRDWLIGAAGYRGPYQQPDGIRSIETPDQRTIVFRLRSPHADFPYLATATQFAPVPRKLDTGTRYEDHPISSGPYKIETYQKNKSLVLVRNTSWSREVDKLRLGCPDRIEIQSGLDAAVINQRLVTGSGADARAITTDTPLGPEQLAQVGSDPQLAKRVARGVFGDTIYLAFNTQAKPFDDIRVRQAFSYAVNRRSVVDAAGGSSLAYPATTFLPEGKAFGFQRYDQFPAGETGNPAKAKEVLAAAGYPAGLKVTLVYDNDERFPQTALAVQDALKQAGITLTLQSLEPGDFRTVTGKLSTQPALSLQSWGADWPAGGPFLVPIFDGRQILTSGGNFNLARYNDPAVNAEIDAINQVTDPDQAAARWGALDARIGQQALIVPLYHSKNMSLFGKEVRNAYVDEWRGTYDIAMVSVR